MTEAIFNSSLKRRKRLSGVGNNATCLHRYASTYIIPRYASISIISMSDARLSSEFNAGKYMENNEYGI